MYTLAKAYYYIYMYSYIKVLYTYSIGYCRMEMSKAHVIKEDTCKHRLDSWPHFGVKSCTPNTMFFLEFGDSSTYTTCTTCTHPLVVK